MKLYGYFKEWRKNPHWSWSCGLAFFLPLNDLQGDIRVFDGMNVLTNQLQTGTIDMPTIQSSVKDSGAIDVSLEEGNHDDNIMNAQDFDCLYAQYSNITRQQGTQTELNGG